jgi:2-polyprenyl-3-methyl-5-hydroxy-6-metoxy-1,4-benzoquinol methylase
MSKIFTTEITSEQIPSDNPVHQRLLKAYVIACEYVSGDVLEVGCGEGRGIDLILSKVRTYSAIDKIEPVIEKLRTRYPAGTFYSGHIPPFAKISSDAYDFVISFQVIEHIKDDRGFLREVYRVLKPGGTAMITTPNRPMSLSRNPWHIREYTASELGSIASEIFSTVAMKGIAGNDKVMTYYERNRKSVNRIMRWDIFDLQHKLPAALLRAPYEVVNRLNRNRLKDDADELVTGIHHEDYHVVEDADSALDLLLIARK